MKGALCFIKNNKRYVVEKRILIESIHFDYTRFVFVSPLCSS